MQVRDKVEACEAIVGVSFSDIAKWVYSGPCYMRPGTLQAPDGLDPEVS